MTAYWCEHAYVQDQGVVDAVRIEVVDGGISTLTPGGPADGATRLRGLVLPGLANAHSHAFHRALRGRTYGGTGDFWTWREQMYAVAERLDPDSYLRLATAVYAEMALAGITRVGEFHYLHHGPGGTPYDEPNVMQSALAEAAAAAGICITLLDTCYLTGGIGRPLEGVQRRFGDGDADAWASRTASRTRAPHVVLGAAVHSVRAVPADQLDTVARAWPAPLHVHLSEQPAENEACLAAYGVTPTRLLAEHEILRPGAVAVHATHLSADDITLVRELSTDICLCPTTERELADGLPSWRVDEVCGVVVGSDSNAVVDLFEEVRGVVLHEQLATGRRAGLGHVEWITNEGHCDLLAVGSGILRVGGDADLVAVRLDSVRTAGGGDPLSAVLAAATAADVTDVVVGGRPVVREGVHLLVPDVPRALDEAIGALYA